MLPCAGQSVEKEVSVLVHGLETKVVFVDHSHGHISVSTQLSIPDEKLVYNKCSKLRVQCYWLNKETKCCNHFSYEHGFVILSVHGSTKVLKES